MSKKAKEVWVLTFRRDRPTRATATFREVCTVVFDNYVEYDKARRFVQTHPHGQVLDGENVPLTDTATVELMLRLPYMEV